MQDAFFRTDLLTGESDLDPILRGLAHQAHQEVDLKVVDGLRNFLFGPPGAGGFDLASLNIQRGRDHGLPSYNDTREQFGLSRMTDSSEMTSDPEVAAQLASVYDSVDDVDVWVGGLAEDHVAGGLLGELFATIVADQFERLRSGDRFYYQRHLKGYWLQYAEEQTLAKIIRRNTGIGNEIPDNVFLVE